MLLDPPLDALVAERCTRLYQWQDKVHEATTAVDIDRIVEEYLGTWTKPEIARIPEGLWPGRTLDRARIREAAVALLRAEPLAKGDDRLLVQVLSDFLSTAAVRFGQVGTRISP